MAWDTEQLTCTFQKMPMSCKAEELCQIKRNQCHDNQLLRMILDRILNMVGRVSEECCKDIIGNITEITYGLQIDNSIVFMLNFPYNYLVENALILNKYIFRDKFAHFLQLPLNQVRKKLYVFSQRTWKSDRANVVNC